MITYKNAMYTLKPWLLECNEKAKEYDKTILVIL